MFEHGMRVQTRMMALAASEMQHVAAMPELSSFISNTGTLDLYDTSASFDAVQPERETNGGNRVPGAQQRHQPVETSAPCEHGRLPLLRDFEDKAGIVIQWASEAAP